MFQKQFLTKLSDANDSNLNNGLFSI